MFVELSDVSTLFVARVGARSSPTTRRVLLTMSFTLILFRRIPQVHQELKFPDLGGKLALTGAAYSLSVGPLGRFGG